LKLISRLGIPAREPLNGQNHAIFSFSGPSFAVTINEKQVTLLGIRGD